MKIIRIIFFAGLLITLFLFLPFSFFLNKKLTYYSYKEVVYRTLINDIVGKEKNPKMICSLMLDYFYYYLHTPNEAEVVDKDVYNDLIRNIAWCDQRSWAMETFLGKLGMDNRLIMTINPKGISNHTILEVFIDNKWVLFDPMYGFVFKDNNGGLTSYDDICRDPSLFYLCHEMLMLKEIEPKKYKKVKDYFTENIFYNNPKEPIIWKNPVKARDFKHQIIAKVMDFYIYIFRKNFSHRYQDVYLGYFSPNKKSDRIFFKARNYDLFNRYQPAVDGYKNFINDFPEDTVSEDALFFLGKLYNKTKNFESSILTLKILLRRYPETKWRRLAHYYIGYNYELLSNYKLAKDYYRQAIYMYKQLAEGALFPGELKVIRRLYNLLKESG